jgi:hydrogenase maturation protease
VSAPRLLVAGIGNIFFGDDAFGVEVVRRLASRPLPPNAKVVDFGIRGMHLAYEIVSGYDVVIFVDAAGGRGEEPGTLYVIEPALSEPNGRVPDAHGMELENVFAFVRQLGGSSAKFLLVGCEPADLREGMGLSPAVAAAVPAAASLAEDLVRKYANSVAGIPAMPASEAIA